jgi:hypothetical protein
MTGVKPYLEHGPATYQVASAVTGGQLVVYDSGNPGCVKTAPTAAVGVLGVAGSDAGVRSAQIGNNPAIVDQVPDYVDVYYDVDINVTYTTAANLGDLLKTSTTVAGQVEKWISGTDLTDKVVGRCTEPLGIASGGTVGRARIGSL